MIPEVVQEVQPQIEIVSESQPEVVLKENGRAKFTINLQNIFNTPKQESKAEENKVIVTANDEPIDPENLKRVWEDFRESRKNQAAEYHLLSRDFMLADSLITIPLSNPIEEPLLQNIRLQLTTFLRVQLKNHSISVAGVLKDIESKKVAYTNKEKFDYLAEKNPILRELKERLGLDTDY